MMERARREHHNEDPLPNATYWLEHELRKSPRVELDLAAHTERSERIVLAGGREAQDQGAYQPNKVLARLPGTDVLDLPGGHLGFMSDPTGFAKAYMDALKDD